jgi:ubiquinone/menaquinone biosynthesis C-methylase UbiE
VNLVIEKQPTAIHNIFTRLVRRYSLMNQLTLVPLLGRFIAGQRQNYSYWGTSGGTFHRPKEWAARIAAADVKKVMSRHLVFGTVAIHRGKK